ncbi:CoA pyrophosphatase [Fusibacter bizertensis]|uniref:CoA pyrophosphatase n=1 Tax=Fusibacter bizertensis TaxID=1488331 RepID=A0ABT6NB20_9FIRM|nr:CoA pyrophosphatase [Fusibacter bizertensis]MDH8677614.1 CoA pyrophosphatase [Fusibacter bizertensis]
MIDTLIDLIQGHKPNTSGVRRQSSVLIPLILRDGCWHLLFEKRALTLKSQPGEICFPGGSIEEIEHSREAAIRETCEELGILDSDIQLIGQIDSILTSFDMIIHCFVGIIKYDFDKIPFSKDEVDHIFTVPVQYFVKHQPTTYIIDSKFKLSDDFPYQSIPEGKNYNFKTMKYPVVFYDYEDYTIWGLTARMTEQFINMLEQSHIDAFICDQP